MKKIKYVIAILIVMLAVTVSCKKDDDAGPTIIPPRDRGTEALREQDSIEKFLESHFYNYKDFENPPVDFDYRIRFDTIPEGNTELKPLIGQVDFKMVKDLVDDSVEYKLYYLSVRKGGADEHPHFCDKVTNTYDGRLMNLDLFDSSVIPVQFDLVESATSSGIIRGLQQAMIEFKGAKGEPIINPDGTLTFEDYGIGAVFIPSGLAYFQYPPASGGLNEYEQLIFSFQLFDFEVMDHDNDGINSYLEDLSNKGYFVDDTDGDGVLNYLDYDDDGDGRPTEFEIEIINGVVIYPDKNGNGIVDYLDPTI